MIDIPILYMASRHIASIARRNNRSPRRYVWLLILAWYGGAFLGGYSAGVIHKAAGGAASESNPPTIAGAAAGALAGLGIVFIVVSSMRPLGRNIGECEDYADFAIPALDSDRRGDVKDEIG
jgi:hypothetical protein